MLVFLIILIVLLVIGVVSNLVLSIEELEYKYVINLILFIVCIFMALFYNESIIDPIEVYKGNTELEYKIKYQDNEIIKLDSIVVWKDKCK